MTRTAKILTLFVAWAALMLVLLGPWTVERWFGLTVTIAYGFVCGYIVGASDETPV